MKRPLKFAIVGLDHWYIALEMVQSILNSKKAELVAIVDSNKDRAEQIAQQYEIGFWSTDYRNIFEQANVQAIGSFVTPSKNAEVCIAAAKAGKHIISTKPIAMNLKEAKEITNVVRRANIKFFPFESYMRLLPEYTQAKKWIKEGRIGELIFARGVAHASLPVSWPGSNSPGWFSDPSMVPGGAWIDHAIFYINLFYWFFNSEAQCIWGRVDNIKHKQLAVEDFGIGILKFRNGGIATIESSWSGASKFAVELIGTEGYISIDDNFKQMFLLGNFPPFRRKVSVPFIKEKNSLVVDYFVDCILADRPLVCSIEEATRDLATCLDFYKCANLIEGKTNSHLN